MSKFIFSAQDVSISGHNNGKRGTEGKEERGKRGGERRKGNEGRSGWRWGQRFINHIEVFFYLSSLLRKIR